VAWAVEAQSAQEPRTFLSVVAQVVCAAQTRSAGVILAAYEPAASDAGIHFLIADRATATSLTTWSNCTLVPKTSSKVGRTLQASLATARMVCGRVALPDEEPMCRLAAEVPRVAPSGPRKSWRISRRDAAVGVPWNSRSVPLVEGLRQPRQRRARRAGVAVRVC
jgi:hypothetical protein